jgi:hypothetical protein
MAYYRKIKSIICLYSAVGVTWTNSQQHRHIKFNVAGKITNKPHAIYVEFEHTQCYEEWAIKKQWIFGLIFMLFRSKGNIWQKKLPNKHTAFVSTRTRVYQTNELRKQETFNTLTHLPSNYCPCGLSAVNTVQLLKNLIVTFLLSRSEAHSVIP